MPVLGVSPVSAHIADTLRRERLLVTLATAFGIIALGLIAIGVYAMFSGLVSRRSREIAIRMAIGSDRTHIARLLAGEAAVLALCGVGLGMVGAIAAGSAIRSQLFNVESTDAGTFAMAAAIIVTVVALALWLPGRRAIGVRPAEVLRAE